MPPPDGPAPVLLSGPLKTLFAVNRFKSWSSDMKTPESPAPWINGCSRFAMGGRTVSPLDEVTLGTSWPPSLGPSCPVCSSLCKPRAAQAGGSSPLQRLYTFSTCASVTIRHARSGRDAGTDGISLAVPAARTGWPARGTRGCSSRLRSHGTHRPPLLRCSPSGLWPGDAVLS